MKVKFGKYEKTTGVITNNRIVEQEFVALENMKAIELDFGTYMRQNMSAITITLFDKNNPIKTAIVQCSELIDNQYHYISFDCFLTAGKTYKLQFTSNNATTKNGVTLKYGQKQNENVCTLIVNKIIVQGNELCMNIVFDKDIKTARQQRDNPNPVQTQKIKENPQKLDVEVETSKSSEKKDEQPIQTINILLNEKNKNLNKQFESIKAQTYKNVNVIVVGKGKESTIEYEGLKVTLAKQSNLGADAVVLELGNGVLTDENALLKLAEKIRNYDLVSFDGTCLDKKAGAKYDKSFSNQFISKNICSEGFTDRIEKMYNEFYTLNHLEEPLIDVEEINRKVSRNLLEIANKGKDKKEIAVYTCVTNKYDVPVFPNEVPKKVALYCFLDQITHDAISKQDHVNYIIVPESIKNRLGNKTARAYKILGHRLFKNFEHNIWIDGNMTFTGSFLTAVKTLGTKRLMLFKHPFREDVYMEGNACVRLKKDTIDKVIEQVQKYKKLGFSEKSLMETGVLVRKTRDEELIALMETWWREVFNESHRDQISLPYVLKETGFEKMLVLENEKRKKFVKMVQHLNR